VHHVRVAKASNHLSDGIGFTNGCKKLISETVSNGGSAEVTGCTVRRFLGDGIRAMNIPARLQATIRGNLICEPWNVNEWGTHRDGIQVGTFADRGGYHLDISGNVIVIGGPAEGQGVYLDYMQFQWGI
jgi:hypothetical protein